MRLSGRHVVPEVAVAPDTSRPIRLRTGALTYMLTADEALGLAARFAAAVDELRQYERNQT
jgi:hypothetical protein